MSTLIYTNLMNHRDEQEPIDEAHFFAQCISHHAQDTQGKLSAALGLTQTQFRMLLNRYFAKVIDNKPLDRCIKVHLNRAVNETFLCQCHNGKNNGASLIRMQEVLDMQTLLLDHCSHHGEQFHWMAIIIATACMGNNHLWQDLGLSNRDELNQVISRYFPILFNKNTANMKWKKFFYKQLCDMSAVSLCLAPTCDVCFDYEACFGLEEPVHWKLLSNQN
ncbi:MAG: nitrogen fixation protein NifQ [Halothiobacillus sp.]